MKPIVAFIFLCASAVSAAAADIKIRSGEHETFTRFVFYLPEGVSVDARSDGNRIRISATPRRSNFDTTGIFARIPKSRVTNAISADQGQLDLQLKCDCTIRTFKAGSQVFVLDVRGDTRTAAKPPRLAFSMAIAPPPLKNIMMGTARLGFPQPGVQGEAQVRNVERRATDVAPTPVQNALNAAPKNRVVQMPATLPDMDDPDAAVRQGRVRDAEQRLLEQLAKAATQGLLDPSRMVPGRSTPERRDSPNSSKELPPRFAPEHERRSITAETTIDRDRRNASARTRPVTSDGEACFADDLLDVTAWAGGNDFNIELGKLRSALYGERDIVNRDAVRNLARFYIRYGFGAEALRTLSESPSNTVEWTLLRSMAEIIENGREESLGIFHGQIDCDSPSALWAALAHDDLRSGFKPNVTAILRALSAMPADLRQHLGPMLAERFLDAGQRDAAESILRLVDRGLETRDLPHDVAEAKVNISKGETRDAETVLNEAIAANSPDAPAALIALIDSKLSQQSALPPAIVELAQAFVTELRGQAIAPEIERVAILATAAAGQHNEALGLLDTARDLQGSAWHEARSQVAEMIARDAEDLALITLSARLANNDPTDLSPAAGNALAERLAGLGFNDLALVLVSGPASGDENLQRRMIRAKIAVADRRPRRAEAELLGIEGPEAEQIRAEAKALSGNHDSASRTFASVSDKERAAEQAWLAGNWTEVASSGDGIRAEAANLILRQAQRRSGAGIEPESSAAPQPDNGATKQEDGPLARNRALLDASSAARGILESLLTEAAVANEADG